MLILKEMKQIQLMNVLCDYNTKEKGLQVPLRDHPLLSARQAAPLSVFASDTLQGFKSIYLAIYFFL